MEHDLFGKPESTFPDHALLARLLPPERKKDPARRKPDGVFF